MRRFFSGPFLVLLAISALAADHSAAGAEEPVLRIGVIGLDTSHAVSFTELLNAERPDAGLSGCRIVAAYPQGSPDIASSVSRVPRYTERMRELGVEIVDSIDELLPLVDAVLLETNDGRPHLEQVIPVLKARKPVFVDKPIAASLADAVAIFELGKKYETPVFSSSSLRYSEGAQAIRGGAIGNVIGCDAFSPCPVEKTHPDLFWYGIHGVETLFTVMGTGCASVSRVNTPGADVVVGRWSDGRLGTFRGIRAGKGGYGGMAFGSKENRPIGPYAGYKPLVQQIIKFFRSGQAPVAPQETLEIYAFMEAAELSKQRDGAKVRIAEVLAAAQRIAAEKVTAN